jgi:hypothetical protein
VKEVHYAAGEQVLEGALLIALEPAALNTGTPG